MSSNHALQAVKRLYRADKAGHAGTLDPLASGLLPVLLGDATRFSSYLLDADKRYRARIQLGVTTDTGDAEGRVLERRVVDTSRAEVEAILPRFRGPQTQIPPMHSALKREGTPLYVLARRGETVEREPRHIDIKLLEVIEYESESFLVDVVCTKGTYIRTLAEDIGAALGCGAHLTELRRTATGALKVDEAATLDRLEGLGEEGRDALLVPADRVLGGLPRCDLDTDQQRRFLCGQTVPLASPAEGLQRVYGIDGNFLGLAEAGAGMLIPRRLLSDANQAAPSG